MFVLISGAPSLSSQEPSLAGQGKKKSTSSMGRWNNGNANVIILNSFYSNLGTDSNGGAIFQKNPSEVNITACIFEKCSANTGGAAYVSGQSANCTLAHCCFVACTADTGSSVYVKLQEGSDSISMEKSIFYLCEADIEYGFLFQGSTKMEITSINNTRSNAVFGYAVSSTSPSSTGSGCFFSFCLFANASSSLYILYFAGAKHSVESCEFINSTTTSNNNFMQICVSTTFTNVTFFCSTPYLIQLDRGGEVSFDSCQSNVDINSNELTVLTSTSPLSPLRSWDSAFLSGCTFLTDSGNAESKRLEVWEISLISIAGVVVIIAIALVFFLKRRRNHKSQSFDEVGA